jgi:hypothetical protein
MDSATHTDQPTRELQAIAAAIVALLVALAPLASIPTWELARRFLGSELTLRVGADLIGAALVAGLVGAAALAGPLPDGTKGWQGVLALVAHWSLPMLWSLTMWTVAPNLSAALVRAAFAVAGGVGLGLLMRFSEPRSASASTYEANLFVDLATYATVLALLTMLQAAHLRSALSATSTVALTALAALGLLCRVSARPWETLAASVTVGMLLGQLTWALNYCPVAPATAGGLLLIAFYALVGILRHALRNRLRPYQVIEYALVGLAGVALIVFRGQIWGA